MPIPIPPINNALHTLCSRVKQFIFDTRIGTDRVCICHDDEGCLLSSKSSANETIVINVLQKNSDILLERWMLTQTGMPMMVDSIPDIISSFACEMPLYNLLDDLYVIASDNKSQCQCYSYRPKHAHMEFMQDSKLNSKKFQFSDQFIEVVYDEHIQRYKRPVISLVQSNLPWHSVRTESNDAMFPLRRRLSRLSMSALEEEEQQEENNNTTTTTTISQQQRLHYIHSINTTSVATTIPRHHHHQHHTYNSTHNNNTILYRRNSMDLHPHRLVGSFEESLLSGRMSSMPCKSIPFHCQIGVLGIGPCKRSLRCPPHYTTTFPAMYYPHEALSTPYVGTIDLERYRIPPQGQIQVIIKNPNKCPVKLFLIPYNFNEMPPNTKTFLRQKSYCQGKRVLKYAIHLQVYKSKQGRMYLYKSMRVVFANRKADAHEKFEVVCEGPNEPMFVPFV
ncbi:hypothetical protein K501DRAFT_288741 [Backusella circina FSU 941]|nr:hypothetical protein K501DRAFT_288741 [Backusella circina FSU 941]